MTSQPPSGFLRNTSLGRRVGSPGFRRELGPALSVRLSVRRRLLAAGLAVGAVAFGLAAVRPAPPPTVRVVAAAQDLDAGTRLERTHLTTVDLPTGAVPDGALRAPDDARGRVIATPTRRGEPLTDVRLSGPELLSGYGDGLVAAPVRIFDPGTARLLRPGDRVDVLAARTSTEEAAGDPVRSVAPDVAVVAVPRDGEAASTATSEGVLVLLATTSEQAAALAQAAATSRLSVVLRGGAAGRSPSP